MFFIVFRTIRLTAKWTYVAGAMLLLSCVTLPVFSADPVDFKITTAERIIDVEELRGDVVYIDFWASWCAPCRKSFPWMNEMHAKYADKGLKIIAVNLDKDRSLSDMFLSEVPAVFTIGFDPEGILADQFGLVGMPSAYVINREGELIDTHVGFRAAKLEEYEASIVEALKTAEK